MNGGLRKQWAGEIRNLELAGSGFCVCVSNAGAVEAQRLDAWITFVRYHTVRLSDGRARRAEERACLELAFFVELTKHSSRSSNPRAWRQTAPHGTGGLRVDTVRAPMFSKISDRVFW